MHSLIEAYDLVDRMMHVTTYCHDSLPASLSSHQPDRALACLRRRPGGVSLVRLRELLKEGEAVAG